MIYLLLGGGSTAIKKIHELKDAFLSKHGNSFSLEDIDCRDGVPDNFFELLGASSMFNQKRLVVIRGAVDQNPKLTDFFEVEFPRMQESPDVFVFWEQKLADKDLKLFKKYSQKIQEFHGDSESAEQKNDKAVFGFVDQVFNNRFSHSLIALANAKKSNLDEAEVLRVILWKLKNIFLVKKGETKSMHPYVAKKTAVDATQFTDTQLLDTFWQGILADSNLKRDSKNAAENLERFLLKTKENITKN